MHVLELQDDEAVGMIRKAIPEWLHPYCRWHQNLPPLQQRLVEQCKLIEVAIRRTKVMVLIYVFIYSNIVIANIN